MYENQIKDLAEEGAPEVGIMMFPSQTHKGAGKPIHLLTTKETHPCWDLEHPDHGPGW